VFSGSKHAVESTSKVVELRLSGAVRCRAGLYQLRLLGSQGLKVEYEAVDRAIELFRGILKSAQRVVTLRPP
jgi:hypothetical protein